jgi:preprotein translocase subunit SecE
MKDKFGLLVNFLKETRSELRKVVWPERRYITVATTIILILVIITGVYVMGVDLVFNKLFEVLLK